MTTTPHLIGTRTVWVTTEPALLLDEETGGYEPVGFDGWWQLDKQPGAIYGSRAHAAPQTTQRAVFATEQEAHDAALETARRFLAATARRPAPRHP